jgi:hypothetical protein
MFLLRDIFHQLFGGTRLSPPCSRSPFGHTNTASVYAREFRRALPQPSPAIDFVGMTGYSAASFHDLFSDDDLLSEGSSIGDLSPLGCPALRECAMADMQGRQPVPVETEDTHTALDPCAQALANAQAHGEDLRWRW